MDLASFHPLHTQSTGPGRTPPHAAFAHREVEREARPPCDQLSPWLFPCSQIYLVAADKLKVVGR